MHLVVQNLLLFYGPEGAQPHMEGDPAQPHTQGGNLLQQLRGKVEPRRRGGGGAADLGVHRLIPLLFLELLFNVGGQGHPAQPLQHLQKNPPVGEAHQPYPVAGAGLSLHRGGEPAVPKADLDPGPQLPPRPHQTFPHVVSPVRQQKNLAAAPGGPPAQQPGGNHPGVVHDQTVSRS